MLGLIRRRPNPVSRPAGTRLHYLEQGSYGAAAGIILVAIFGELPVSHLFASLMVADPALELKVHLLLGVASIYSLVWVAGDRWHVSSCYHVLGEDEGLERIAPPHVFLYVNRPELLLARLATLK